MLRSLNGANPKLLQVGKPSKTGKNGCRFQCVPPFPQYNHRIDKGPGSRKGVPTDAAKAELLGVRLRLLDDDSTLTVVA
ncbi:hypothetical protein CHU98_g2419 [Xylaria longipes]|nr:hypothetical protein CHU98_g2419 [Xylaria longipes]